VTCGASAGAQPATDLRRIFWHHLKVFGSALGSRAELRHALNFLEATATKPVIDKVFPLGQAAMAQQRLAAGQHFGKIVLDIDG
jgi:NADPH:quinone reductase-like Zn-dependent oxidoreductase